MRAARIALVTAGVAAMAYAVGGALTSADLKLSRHGLFLVGSLLLFDVVLAPLFIAVGFAVRRLVPTLYRAVVQGALVVTAAVTFVAVPLVLGYGRTPDLPSALPRDYLGGYLLVLAVVWTVAGALIGRRALVTRRRIMRHSRKAGTRPV